MTIAKFVLDALLWMVLLKLLGLCLSGFLVLRLGAGGKFAAFWKEYWRWEYAKDNTLSLAVWFVTVCGYWYCCHMLLGARYQPMAHSFDKHPALTVYVILATLWVIISTGIEVVLNLGRTVSLCRKIDNPSLMKRYGRLAIYFSLLYFEISGWPLVLGTVLGAVIPEIFVNFSVERKLGRAVERFLWIAFIEYFLRASIVIAAFYVETGQLRFW